MLRRALVTGMFAMALGSAPLTRAADLPGGLMRTAAHLPTSSYELLVSPAYLISAEGAYLTSQLRYQAFDALGVGVGFGAGEVGFNFGAQAVFHIAPHLNLEPDLAVITGMYFNRVSPGNYFVVKAVPTVSQTFFLPWGEITPYAGIHFTPSFRLNGPANEFSLRTTLGSQLTVRTWDGLRLLVEAGIGMLNSTHELAIGISYPFAAL